MDQKTAIAIYKELKQISEKILEKFFCLPEPSYPKQRTTSWQHGKPVGIVYHYTGGSSGLNAIRWANDARCKNSESSWHVTILDRNSKDPLGKAWTLFASEAIKALFPVPTIIMASWSKGTWHGNWTCDSTIGIENRNGGYSLKPVVLQRLRKKPFVFGKRSYEPYTREQLICNINIGRLVQAYFGQTLNPGLILPHSAVWATKNDPGPNFPIHQIRELVLNDEPVNTEIWLEDYPEAAEIDDLPETVPFQHGMRGPTEPFEWSVGDEKLTVASDLQATTLLHKMGYNVFTDKINPQDLKKAVYYFQLSTRAYKKIGREDKVLLVDGILGSKTEAAMFQRMSELGKQI
jgi:N-acetyl-anhydromuramyl-L-alanine amidase AmpD